MKKKTKFEPVTEVMAYAPTTIKVPIKIRISDTTTIKDLGNIGWMLGLEWNFDVKKLVRNKQRRKKRK